MNNLRNLLNVKELKLSRFGRDSIYVQKQMILGTFKEEGREEALSYLEIVKDRYNNYMMLHDKFNADLVNNFWVLESEEYSKEEVYNYFIKELEKELTVLLNND